MTEPVIDPEDVTRPTKAEIEEAEVDAMPDSQRPQPIEADPADVAEQRSEVVVDDERREDPEDRY